MIIIYEKKRLLHKNKKTNNNAFNRNKTNQKIVFHSFRRKMKLVKYFLKKNIYMHDMFRYTQYFIARILPQRVYILLFR